MKPGRAQRTKERLKWRDSLLTKYENRIRELESQMRYIIPWVPHPEIRRLSQEILEKKVYETAPYNPTALVDHPEDSAST